MGARVTVNGRLAAKRQTRDGAGRPMPWWSGCAELGPEEYFLLMTDSGASFDGRYFGITSAGDIVGRARLLWRGGGSRSPRPRWSRRCLRQQNPSIAGAPTSPRQRPSSDEPNSELPS